MASCESTTYGIFGRCSQSNLDKDQNDVLQACDLESRDRIPRDAVFSSRLASDEVPFYRHYSGPPQVKSFVATFPSAMSNKAKIAMRTRTVRMTVIEPDIVSESEGQVTFFISASVSISKSACLGRSTQR